MAAWFRILLKSTLMGIHMAWRVTDTVKLLDHTGWQKQSRYLLALCQAISVSACGVDWHACYTPANAVVLLS